MFRWFRSKRRYERGGLDGWPATPGGGVRVVDVLHATGKERERQATRLANNVRSTPPARLDSFAAGSISGWIGPSDVAKLAALPHESVIEVLGVASMTADGYAREEAIRRLGSIGDPAAVPFLVLRLGDWVPQVRAAARDAVDAFPANRIAGVLIRHHDLVDRLRRIRRVDLIQTHAWLIGIIKREAGHASLRAGLRDSDMRVRRFCLRVLFEIERCRDDAVRSALADPDPGIRAWLAGSVISGRIDVSEAVRRALLTDRAALVSTKMIRSLDVNAIRANEAALLDLACSDARPVRGSARFALRQIEQENIADRACELIGSVSVEQVRAGWVAALGECGGEDALPMLRGFTTHTRGGVRAAALSGIERLDRDAAFGHALKTLEDPNHTVRVMAARVLAGWPGDRWCDRAEALLVSGRAGARRAAFDLLASRGGWDMLVPALHALASDDPVLVERAWWTLSRWVRLTGRFGWLRPSKDLLVRLIELRAAVRPTIAEDRWQENLLGWLDRALEDCRRESGP